MAAGPAARDSISDFARQWTSPLSYPVARLITLSPGSKTKLAQGDVTLRGTPRGQNDAEHVHDTSFLDDLLNATLHLDWVPARLFSEDTDKVPGLIDDGDPMIRRRFAEVGHPVPSLDVVSAQFIPGPLASG